MTQIDRFDRFTGTIGVPGDKSVSHRALILGAMGSGGHIRGLAPGEDVSSTAECLSALGHEVEHADGSYRVRGGWNPAPDRELDAGNSGTTMRLLMGALAGAKGSWVLVGDKSLSRRPMERVAGPLREMGASVETTDGHPPVSVSGAELKGITHALVVPSAQVKSCLLLAGLQAEGPTVIHEPLKSRDHTERMLFWLGIDVVTEGTEVRLEAGTHRWPEFEIYIPGDYSSAAFMIAAVLLRPGSEVTVEGVGLNPTRRGFEEVVSRMKGNVWGEIDKADPEPIGRITARGADALAAVDIGPAESAACIDELPVIAVLATQAQGVTHITGASELRVKESDRIDALAEGLRILGAKIETSEDGMRIQGPTPLHGGSVDAKGDHRLALAFAIAAQAASDTVTIEGFGASSVSYPGFLDDLRTLGS